MKVRIANPRQQRRSELLNLKLTAIDFYRKTVTVFNSKGKKDRVLGKNDG